MLKIGHVYPVVFYYLLLQLGFCSFDNVYYENDETWKTSDCKLCLCQVKETH